MAKRVDKPTPMALKFPGGVPEKPDYVAADAEASGLWDELAPALAKSGVLTETDRYLFAMLCMAHSAWRANPGDAEVADMYLLLLTDFGLTPSSRSAIVADKPRGPHNAS